jgi:hypothetical protein
MPQLYQSVLWVTFHSSESFDRVPINGETLSIPAPVVDLTKEGGVGFHELLDVLKAADRVDDDGLQSSEPDIMKRVIDSGDPNQSESTPKKLDVKVERSCTYITHWI